MNQSPYFGKDTKDWKKITESLVENHPLKNELVDIVLQSWNSIFNSKIGEFYIGKEIFPEPQIMGFLLHELVALYAGKRNGSFQKGRANAEKDIHCTTNEDWGIEIKTSSDKSHIFANRSYAQPSSSQEKKKKDGYFLAINFEKFESPDKRPDILLIRFGYLEHSGWIGQASQTGQRARLSPETYENKFVTLYQKESEKTAP